MTLDKQTRMAIASSVWKATMEAQEVYNEEWLTADKLCEQIPLFTPSWIDNHWKLLPCERVAVTSSGKRSESRRCYPKKKILRLISEGYFRDLQEQNN